MCRVGIYYTEVVRIYQIHGGLIYPKEIKENQTVNSIDVPLKYVFILIGLYEEDSKEAFT